MILQALVAVGLGIGLFSPILLGAAVVCVFDGGEWPSWKDIVDMAAPLWAVGAVIISCGYGLWWLAGEILR